jgi:predicted amidohydrolase YtcJ
MMGLNSDITFSGCRMWLCLAGVSIGAFCWAQPATLVVRNANVYTSDSNRPRTNAIAVAGSRIVALGDDVQARVGPHTRVIDAGGATIIPGLIDSHGHMQGLGEYLSNLDLRDANSAAEVASRVAFVARKTKPGEWIQGRAWDQTRWPGAQFPTAADLDKAAPNHPVFLRRVDGHAAWVNSKALEMADVNAATKDPAGGRIHRDASGKPTGVLIDRAVGLVSAKIPALSREQVRESLARAAQECARLGLTSVHDAGVSAEVVAAYRELIAEKRLPVRVYAMIRGEGELWAKYLKSGPEIGERLTVRSIKLVADGALGSRGAALKEPYSDEPANRGLMITGKDAVERVALAAVERGFQVNTHAIGDRANREVLDAYGGALGGKNDKRFRVEHAQVVSVEDISLFAKYSVLASMQATHATSDMRWAEQRVGPGRIEGAYAWQRFLKLGIPVVNGSDFPVENPNPLWGFYASITRQDHSGSPRGGWRSQERMSREQALESWTAAGAYAAFEEKDKGTIAPGKLADFVMLSADIMQIPPAEILRARVRMTVLGGEVVFQEKP